MELDIWAPNRQIIGMTKKSESRRPAQDESQIALSVVEKAIGGKLVDKKNSANLPLALHPNPGKAVAKKPSKP